MNNTDNWAKYGNILVAQTRAQLMPACTMHDYVLRDYRQNSWNNSISFNCNDNNGQNTVQGG